MTDRKITIGDIARAKQGRLGSTVRSFIDRFPDFTKRN
jgi:hypothetical protein